MVGKDANNGSGYGPADTLKAARAERRPRPVPAALARHAFRPGVSGNPGGKTALFAECQRVAREASPAAIRRLIELMDSEDERVALTAADKVLDRAWGKPREVPENRENDIRSLPAADRRKRLLELLSYAASVEVPEDHEANALDEAPEGSGDTTQGVSPRAATRRVSAAS